MKLVRMLAATVVVSGMATGALAAGNLTTGATTIKIDMTADKKFSATEIQMETGKAYNLAITKVAGGELQFFAPDLFGNSYIYQIAIEGREIKTRMIDWLEFDEAGTVTVTLVPNRIGAFKYYVKGQEATM